MRAATAFAATAASVSYNPIQTNAVQAEPTGTCQFAMGFAELRNLIGPEIVGDCLTSEHYDLQNGDAFQQTSRGLLIWKKADNWTAFADGSTTWISSRYGLQRVSNTDSPVAANAQPIGWRQLSFDGTTASPRAMDALGEGGGVGTGSAGPARPVQLAPRSAALPPLTSAEAARLTTALSRSHLPGPALPVGTPITGVRAQEVRVALSPPPESAPSDPTVFRSTALTGISASVRADVDEPSVSNNGPVVFYTANWYAAVSGDSGSTFTFTNPYTDFPASFGGFCCDQLTIYDPGRNITVWSLQYALDSSSNNTRRIAVANGQNGVLNNTWRYWDLSAQAISFPPVSNQTGYWLDYGHMELGANYLYVTSNVFNSSGLASGTVIFRLPLDTLATGGTLSYSYYFAPSGFGFLPVAGATSPMYWARHLNTSTLRVYQWAEGGSVLSADVSHASFTEGFAGQMVCTAPDGTNMCGRDDSRLQAGWAWGSELGFMWDAAQGNAGLGTFAYPYVHVARINAAAATLIDEPILSSPAQAFAYPGAAVNSAGTLGVSAAFAGVGVYPSSALFLRDETSPSSWQSITVRSGTNGPAANEWGDYLTARLTSGSGPTFVGASFTLQGPCNGGSNGCASVEPRFVWFGRLADYPFPPQCSPRPRVAVAIAPVAPGRLQVLISTDGTGVFLKSLQFTTATNALIDAGSQISAAGNFLVNLPAGTQQTTFYVRRAAPGTTTVPLVVNDSCGAWPTFVGGGPNAF